MDMLSSIAYSAASSLPKVSQRRRWTKDEDRYLAQEVRQCLKDGKSIDWRRVSKELTNRSNKDCRKRWLKIDERWNQGQWSAEEDEKLKGAVKLYASRWKAVSDMVETRSPDQCAKRWRNSIDPQLKRHEWSQSDDSKLVMAVDRYGRNWKPIVENVFPGRSRLDLSNRYTGLLRRMRTTHKRTLSGTTIRSQSSSPDEDSSSQASLPSPPAENNDDFFSSSENLSWTPPTSQHAFPSLNSSIHHIMSPELQATEENPMDHHTYHTSHRSVSNVKVEDWPSPSMATIPTGPDHHQGGPIMTSQAPLQSHDMYSSYMPWSPEWGETKSDQEWSNAKSSLADHHDPVYSIAAYVPTTTYSLENGHQTTAEAYVDDGTGRRTITLDNVDDSTRAVILDALCKGKKQVTLVLE